MTANRFAAPAAAACILVGTALFRYLSLQGGYNDQFEHLAGAQQMLAGEWPTVDFFDPGMPLTYGASALAQLVLGRTLFAEAVLTAAMLGVAAACTLLGAYRLSGSLPVALVAALLSVAIFPRSYAYPKLLITAIAPLAIWAWMSVQSRLRLALMALVLVIAFLYRHDYAAYVGLAALTALLIAPPATPRHILGRVTLFGAIVAVLLLPYALSLGGIGEFAESLRSFVDYGRRHSDRTAISFDTLGWTPEWQLFWGFHALPIVALGCAAADWRRGRGPHGSTPSPAQLVVPVCAMAIAANVLLMRDPLSARLADAVVPAVLVGAWLAGRAWRIERGAARAAAMTAVVIAAAVGARAVWAVGATAEQIDRTGLVARGLRGAPELLRAQTAELNERFSPGQVPDGRVLRLVPFFEYLDRCTTLRHRLLVADYAPEIYVYARRLFGGGHKVFLHGMRFGDDERRRMLDRMNSEIVLFALFTNEVTEQWREDFPEARAYIDARFRPLVDVQTSDDTSVRIFVNGSVPATGTDPATGWACYR